MGETVTCLVRGPASRYPRGYLWLIPAWFAILSAAVVITGVSASGKLPFWLGLTEITGLAIAAVTAFCVLATVRQRAFRADSHGIVLGVSTSRKRPKLRQLQLPWPEIAQLRMVPRRYGVELEIALGPTARMARRPGVPRRALLLLGALVMPFSFGRGSPAVTTPVADPPCYRVKICSISAAELRQALAAVQPAALPVRVRTKKPVLPFAVQPPVKPLSQQPPTPVG